MRCLLLFAAAASAQMDCTDERVAPPLQLLRCTRTSTDDSCTPATSSTSPEDAMLRLTALDIETSEHVKVFDYYPDGFTKSETDSIVAGAPNRKNVNAAAMLHVDRDGDTKSYMLAAVDDRLCNMSPENWGYDPAADKTTGDEDDEDGVEAANCLTGLQTTQTVAFPDSSTSRPPRRSSARRTTTPKRSPPT